MVHRALANAEKCSPTQEKHSLEISLEQIDLSAAKQVETTGGRGPTLVVFGAGIADHIVVAASLFHRGASAVHIPSRLIHAEVLGRAVLLAQRQLVIEPLHTSSASFETWLNLL